MRDVYSLMFEFWLKNYTNLIWFWCHNTTMTKSKEIWKISWNHCIMIIDFWYILAPKLMESCKKIWRQNTATMSNKWKENSREITMYDNQFLKACYMFEFWRRNYYVWSKIFKNLVKSRYVTRFYSILFAVQAKKSDI